ncbi:hypothetical protein HK104_008985 [Borealophlyctis nickersoniae]|nr:hypothetical protein HK104_008985 [Borealophlyctis nickersoniae]
MSEKKRKPSSGKHSQESPRKRVATQKTSPTKSRSSQGQKTLDSFFRPNRPLDNNREVEAAHASQAVEEAASDQPSANEDVGEWEEWPAETWQNSHEDVTPELVPVSDADKEWEKWPSEASEAAASSPCKGDDEHPRIARTEAERPSLNPPPVASLFTHTGKESDAGISPQQSCLMDVLKYNPDLLPSYWVPGERTPYRWLSDQFQLVDGQTGRLIITEVLTNMLRTIIRHSPEDLLPALYLSSNSIAPPYEGVEMGIGPQVIIKAITSISDMSSKSIKAQWDKKGDWGDVVFTARMNMKTLRKPKPLTVAGVHRTMVKLSTLKGQGTVTQKTNLVKELMVACQGEELRYLTRTLVSHLRIGAVRTTILIALSHAVVMEFDARNASLSKDAIKSLFKQAEQTLKVPNYDIIVPLLLDPNVGIWKINDVCQCQPGVPIRPMLGKITRDLADVFEKLQGVKFCADFKYDGQRAQIHRSETGTITIFSRHLETITTKYPDIVSLIPTILAPSTTSFIIDTEVVAIDDQGVVQPFQTLSNRGRKNVEMKDVKVGVKVYGFDLMYLNGVSLLKSPFRLRRDAMREAFKEVEGRFGFVPQIESSDADEIQEFLTKSLAAGCEGLMVKVLDAPAGTAEKNNGLLATYEPDKRSGSWLKVKKDYLESLADSFDLVPIGAWYGNGRKAGWYSPFLMACYNPETEMYETVCKCMSGFTDAFYKQKLAKYTKESGNVLDHPKNYYAVSEGLRPDVWFLPIEVPVWEIRGADLTLSPVHLAAAGKADPARGISLRFPRFIREREDKSPEDATTPDQIVEMFHKQRNRAPEVARIAEEDELEEEEEADVED